MDNNYDYYSGAPQPPFNEKPNGQPQENTEIPRDYNAADFNPEKPLMKQEEKPSAPVQDYPTERQIPPQDYPRERQNPPQEYPGERQNPPQDYPREWKNPPQEYPGERQNPPHDYPRERQNPPQDYPREWRNPPQDYPRERQNPPREYAYRQPPREGVQDREFNPVEHTATYQNGEFRPQANGYDAGEREFVYSNRSDYSNPSYYNPNAAGAPARREPEQPPYPPTSAPLPYGDPYAAAPREENKERAKSNKGLVAVIIVLAVLLAASLAGIFIYVLSTGSEHNAEPAPTESINNFGVPNFTMPQLQPQETEPPVHNESDYSDQTDKNYSGLKVESKPSDADKNTGYNAEYAYKSISESVVGIVCYSDEEQTATASQGSGTIIDEDGYVITNSHVIGNSRTAYSIKVVTSDGKEYKAGVIGCDPRTDISVLKIDGAKGLKAAAFGTSTEITVGEDIIIVGNPGGLSFKNSMTKGIVSALDRDVSNKSIVKYIQTDAAINPGNSGGPAVNMYGQVIGIASSKIALDYYENMGFCIPSDTVKTIVDSLIKNGYVENRVRIGITGMAVSDMETYEQLPSGIYVQEIDKSGPCGGTELKAGDIITKLDGESISNFSEIYNVLEGHKDGDKVKLTYYRPDTGKENEIEITLAADTQ